jgi:hypothetical protein
MVRGRWARVTNKRFEARGEPARLQPAPKGKRRRYRSLSLKSGVCAALRSIPAGLGRFTAQAKSRMRHRPAPGSRRLRPRRSARAPSRQAAIAIHPPKGDQREARRGIDDMPKALCYGDAGEPDKGGDQQGREHVPDPGLKGCACCLASGSARWRAMSFTAPNGPGRSVHTTDGGDGADQDELGTKIHGSAPCSCWCSPSS